MATLDEAKKVVLALFKSSLPPSTPTPIQFTTVNQITRPILNIDTYTASAHQMIAGTFLPGNPPSQPLPGWSTADDFATAYLNMVQNMAYGLSTADQNQITNLETKNQSTLNNLVNTYEQTYGRITQAQMTAASVLTKIDYFVAQVPTLKKSLNWSKFAPEYNSASADIDIMSNILSAKLEFAQQITTIKTNIKSPSVTNGGTQAFDASNNKTWYPGYIIDPQFPSKFQNGSSAEITVEIHDLGKSSSSFSINGTAGGSFLIDDFIGVSGSTSAQYHESSFYSLMSNVKIVLTYDHVCYLQANPTGLSAGKGWYLPDILKSANHNTQDDTGPFFVTNAAELKATLEKGGLQALQGLLVSNMPTGYMLFEEDSFQSFQKYFHTESHASVDLFGFIPIASANTSYTYSKYTEHGSKYKMKVTLNSSNDQNNLVVHGAVVANPIAGA